VNHSDGSEEHRQAQRRALAGDIQGAQEVVARMHREVFESPRLAEAVAIRPLD